MKRRWIRGINFHNRRVRLGVDGLWNYATDEKGARLSVCLASS